MDKSTARAVVLLQNCRQDQQERNESYHINPGAPFVGVLYRKKADPIEAFDDEGQRKRPNSHHSDNLSEIQNCLFLSYFVLSEPESPPQVSHEESSSVAKEGKRLKIIVVDDEPVIADTLVDILQGEGCDALALSSGQAAIAWARLIQPDVVISDVAMPGMTGIQAAEAIREFLPACRIILFSGQASSVDLMREARASGKQFELLSKPISPNVLLSTLGLSKSS
jgi:CheY-like chemotaxis protein